MNKAKNSIAALVLTGVALTGIGAITTSNSVNNNEAISAMKGDSRYYGKGNPISNVKLELEDDADAEAYNITYTFDLGEQPYHNNSKFAKQYDYLAVETIVGDAGIPEGGHHTLSKAGSQVKSIVANKQGSDASQTFEEGEGTFQESKYFTLEDVDTNAGQTVTVTDTVSYAGVENKDDITVNIHTSFAGQANYAMDETTPGYVIANDEGDLWTHMGADISTGTAEEQQATNQNIPAWHYDNAIDTADFELITPAEPDPEDFTFTYSFDVTPVASDSIGSHTGAKWSEVYDKLAIGTGDEIESTEYHTGWAEGANVAKSEITITDLDAATSDTPVHQELVNTLTLDKAKADENGNIELHTILDWSIVDDWTHPGGDISGKPMPGWHTGDSTWYGEGMPYSDFIINVNDGTITSASAPTRHTNFLSDRVENFEFVVTDSEGNTLTPPTDNAGGEEGLSAGAIAGIVIGSLILVSILIGVIVYFALKSKEA